MELRSERLTITEISWNDIKQIHWLHSKPEVNEFSTLVMEKIGMTRENSPRKKLPIGGEGYDNYQYAMLEDDFRP